MFNPMHLHFLLHICWVIGCWLVRCHPGDDELKKKVDSFLDDQAQLASTYSSIKVTEIDLTEKNEKISELQKCIDELQIKDKIIKLDATTSTEVHTSSVQSQFNSEELTRDDALEDREELTGENSLLTEQRLNCLSENESLKRELLSVKNELEDFRRKLIHAVDSPNSQIQKLETEITNRSMCISVLERQIQELKLVNKKFSEDSSVLQHTNDNLQTELKTLRNEFEIKRKQYEMIFLDITIGQSNQGPLFHCICDSSIWRTYFSNRLTNELIESQKMTSVLQAKYEHLQIQADEAIKSNQVSEEKLIGLKEELDSVRSESRTESAVSKKEIDSLMEKLINAEDVSSSLKNELNLKLKEVKELQTAVIELGRENQTLQVLRERLTNRQWTKDDEAMTCFGCDREFSISTRRHHCRNCGGIFCQNCSLNRASTTYSKDPVRHDFDLLTTCFIFIIMMHNTYAVKLTIFLEEYELLHWNYLAYSFLIIFKNQPICQLSSFFAELG
ncbi:unnamed protein product [Heterobilharzia americana]|nr:unnamed protein product [Heterobilharzia americana]